MTPRTRHLGLAALAAAVLLPAASAQAAGTLSYQGDTLRWTAVDAGQTVMVDGNYHARVGFYTDDVSGAIPDGCMLDDLGSLITCEVPAGGVVLTGGSGRDSFFTGSGAPAGVTIAMNGGAGDDDLKDDNRDGRSVLRGGEGTDTLLGGPGDDDLDGEGGKDELDGQAGADRCAAGPATTRSTATATRTRPPT